MGVAEHDNQFEVSPPTSDAVPAGSPVSFLLLPSYLIGPESWRGVGEVLGRLGYDAVVGGPEPTTPRDVDHITPWVDHMVSVAQECTKGPLALVGHSAACQRLPLVASRLLALGRLVHTLVFVNGKVPWVDGESPCDANPQLREMLDALVRPNDYLPPWHRWWGSMILDMVPDDQIRNRVFDEARQQPRAMFGQPVPVPELPPTVRRAFLATGRSHEPDYERARQLGWKVARLDGEHLHMVVDPVTVAGMLLSLTAHCDRESESPG